MPSLSLTLSETMFGILPESSHYLTSEWFLLSLVLLGEGQKKRESAKLGPDSASSPTPMLSQIFLGCLALATVAQSKHEPVGLKQLILHASVEVIQRTPRLLLRAGPLVHFHTPELEQGWKWPNIPLLFLERAQV